MAIGVGIGLNQQQRAELIKQVQDLIKQIESNPIDVQLNNSDVVKQIEDIKNQLNGVSENVKPIEFKVNTEVTKEQFDKVKGDFENVIAELNKVGTIKDITPKFENGKLDSFVVQLEEVNGILDKISLKTTAYTSSEDGSVPVNKFNITGITEYDNRVKTLNQNLQELQKLQNQLIQDQQKQNELETQEKESNEILIQQEQKKLELLKEQWQARIQQLRENNIVPEENINSFEDNVNNTASSGTLGQTELKNQYQELLNLQNQLNSSKQDELKIIKDVFTQELNEKDQQEKALQQEVDAQESLNKLQSDYLIKLRDIQTANKGAFSSIDLQQQAKTFEELVKSQTTESLNTNEVNTAWKNLSSNVREANVNLRESNGLFSDLGHNMSKMLEWSVAGTAIFASFNQIKEGISFINELNQAETNIQMITGQNSQQVQQLTQNYSDLASQLHETTSSIMTASEEFLRAGNNEKDTAELLKSSTVMSKIAGQSQEDSAQSLISIMNAFHLKATDMMGVVDKMVAVDNNSATSTAELSEAIQKVASSASNAGVTLPQLISYIGTISSVTRESASTIGTSINSIISRYSSIKEGKQFDPDNNPLNNVEKSLNRYGIAIRSDKDTFKDFSTVLSEISEKWKTYTDVQKNDISTQLAGTRQRNQFLTLMDNMNMAMGQQATQADSAGNAMKRYSTYAESTEAKMNDLKNASEQMWMKLINSSTINTAISGFTNLVKTLDFFINDSKQSTVAILGLSTAFVLLVSNAKNVIAAFALIGEGEGIISTMTVLFTGLTTAIKGVGSALELLLLTPEGLAFTALATAIGIATTAIISHVNHEKELKTEVDSLTQSYKSLTQAIKDNTVTEQNADFSKLKSQQDSLSDALKKRAEAQKTLNDINAQEKSDAKNHIVDVGNFAEAQKNAIKVLNDSNKTINSVEEALNEAGIAYNKTTGEIYKVNQAQLLIQNNNIVEKIKQQSQSESDNRNEVIKLIQEYQNLSKEENNNSASKQRMSQIAQELNGKINGLKTATDSQGNTIIQNTDLLGKEVTMLQTEGNSVQTLTNIKLTDAKQTAEIQVNNTTITYTEAKKRIEAIKAEVDALNAKRDAELAAADASANSNDEAQNDKLARIEQNKINSKNNESNAFQSAIDELDKIYSTGSNNGTDLSSSSNSSSSNYFPDSSNSASAKGKAQKSATTAEEKSLEGQIKKLQDAKSAYDTSVENAYKAEQQQEDAIIKGYQTQLDQLQKKKQLQDDTNELLKDQNDLIKAQQDLQNAQNDKNVRVYENGQWQWESDQTAVQKAMDTLSQAQQTINQKKSDIDEKAQEDALNAKIQAEQDKKSAYETNYQNTKDATDQNYDEQINNLQQQKEKLQGYATGGTVDKDKIAKLGEEGAELVLSPTIANVVKGTEVLNADTTAKVFDNLGNNNSNSNSSLDLASDVKDTENNIGKAVTNNKQLIQKPITDLKTQIGNEIQKFVDGSPQYSINANKNLGNAIANSSPSVTSPMQQLISNVKSIITNFSQGTDENGKQINTQIGKGINDSTPDLTKNIDDLCTKIETQFRTDLGIHSPSTVMAQIGTYMMQGLIQGMNEADIEKFISTKLGNTMTSANVAVSGNVADWLKQAIQATGIDMSNLPALESIAEHESGGDPNSINTYDINAQEGHPSQGLMQTIPETFQEYMMAGHNNILNPVDNAIAAIRYILARYGSVSNVPGIKSLARGGSYVGYEQGTDNATEGIHEVSEQGSELVLGRQFMNFHGGETVLNADKTQQLLSGLASRNIPSYEMKNHQVSTNNTNNTPITIQHLELPNVLDGENFVNQLTQTLHVTMG